MKFLSRDCRKLKCKEIREKLQYQLNIDAYRDEEKDIIKELLAYQNEKIGMLEEKLEKSI